MGESSTQRPNGPTLPGSSQTTPSTPTRYPAQSTVTFTLSEMPLRALNEMRDLTRPGAARQLIWPPSTPLVNVSWQSQRMSGFDSYQGYFSMKLNFLCSSAVFKQTPDIESTKVHTASFLSRCAGVFSVIPKYSDDLCRMRPETARRHCSTSSWLNTNMACRLSSTVGAIQDAISSTLNSRKHP